MRHQTFVFFAGCLLAVIWGTGTAAAQQANPRETPAVKVVRENAAAVVNISTEHILLLRENPNWGTYGNELDYFFGQFFGLQAPRRAMKLKSVGSGVVVSKDGLVVTNAHVVHMASTIFVVFNDGVSVPATVVYENLKDDLALVKLEPSGPLKEVALGKTDDLMIGETAIAIGNPLGLENSVTSGIISGKNREVYASNGAPIAEGLIQTDAPINPGNSGGALFNLNGELIGINVAVVQNSQSIGFAIPVERIKEALKNHAENKSVAIKYKAGVADEDEEADQWAGVPGPRQDPWDPFTEMDRMTEEMDRMFQEAFGRGGQRRDRGMFNTDISYDSNFAIEDTGKEYVVKVEMKGIDQNKMNVDIHQGLLTVSGEYSQAQTEENPSGYISSHSVGSFVRSIALPEDADTEKVKTQRQGDFMVITLPKK